MKKQKVKVSNKNNVLPILILLFAVFIGIFYFFQISSLNKENKLAVDIELVKEETKLYKISAEYPQIKKASDNFNNEIKNTVDNKIKDFKKNVTGNWQIREKNLSPEEKPAPNPDSPWPLNITWTPEQLNNIYISFVMRMDSFEGGANEIQDIVTFNYDLVNHKNINLSDLFPNDSNYLNEVSKYAIDTLTDNFKMSGNNNDIPEDMIKEGASPKEENFKRFTFNDNIINFYFPKYQVTPGVFGEQKIVMPRK